MSDYVWRLHVLVPVRQVSHAGEVACKVLPGGESERATFGVPLRADLSSAWEAEGSPVVTYMGASVLVTERQRTELLGALQAAGVEALWAVLRADTEETVAGAPALALEAGHPWNWEDTLAAVRAAGRPQEG